MFGIKNHAFNLDEIAHRPLGNSEVREASSRDAQSANGPQLIPASAFTNGFSVTASEEFEHALDIWLLQPGWMPERLVMGPGDALSLAHALVSTTSNNGGHSDCNGGHSDCIDGTMIAIDWEDGTVHLATNDGYMRAFTEDGALNFALELISAARVHLC